MKKILGVAAGAVALAAMSAGSADACFCGAPGSTAGRVACCDTCECCPQQCSTVMKTCREVVYEQRQYTCYKTCYERVCEQKTDQCVKTSLRRATASAPTRSASRCGKPRCKKCRFKFL